MLVFLLFIVFDPVGIDGNLGESSANNKSVGLNNKRYILQRSVPFMSKS